MGNVKDQVINETKNAFSADKLPTDLSKVARSVGEQAGAVLGDATQSASEFYEEGKRYVRANPAQAVFAAVTVGVLAGSLITLACRRRH